MQKQPKTLKICVSDSLKVNDVFVVPAVKKKDSNDKFLWMKQTSIDSKIFILEILFGGIQSYGRPPTKKLAMRVSESLFTDRFSLAFVACSLKINNRIIV